MRQPQRQRLFLQHRLRRSSSSYTIGRCMPTCMYYGKVHYVARMNIDRAVLQYLRPDKTTDIWNLRSTVCVPRAHPESASTRLHTIESRPHRISHAFFSYCRQIDSTLDIANRREIFVY